MDFYCELPDQIDCAEAVHGYISTKNRQKAPSLSERPLQAVKTKQEKKADLSAEKSVLLIKFLRWPSLRDSGGKP